MTDLGATSPAGRRLISEGARYAGIEAVQNALALLATVMVLQRLSPAEFGEVTLALVAVQVAPAVATLGAEFTVLRRYLVWSDEQRPALVTGLLLGAIAWSTLLAVAAGLLAAEWRSQGVASLVVIGWWSGLLLGLRTMPLAIARVRGRLRVYGGVVIGGSVVQAFAQVTLVYAGGGPLGFLLGQLAGAIVSTLLGFALTSPEWRSASVRLDRESLDYTLRVLPSNLANRLLAVSDRLVLAQFVSLEGLGVYGMASRFAAPVKLVSGSLRMALAPALSRAEHDGELDGVFASSMRLILRATLLMSAAVVLASLFLGWTSWAPVAASVTGVLSLLLWAQCIGAVQVAAQLRVYYSTKAGQSAWSSFAGGVVLLLGLWLLTPVSGMHGAAAAEVLSALASALVAVSFAVRLWPAWHEWSGAITAGLTFGAAVAAALWLDGWMQVVALGVACVGYGAKLAAGMQRLRRQPSVAA